VLHVIVNFDDTSQLKSYFVQISGRAVTTLDSGSKYPSVHDSLFTYLHSSPVQLDWFIKGRERIACDLRT
jgi:hypothetical protein